MLPEHRIPTHPGAILLEHFLEPLRLTVEDLARHLAVSCSQLQQIVDGEAGVSPETAWLFAQAFSTTPEFWSNLQANHDLARHRPSREVPALVATG